MSAQRMPRWRRWGSLLVLAVLLAVLLRRLPRRPVHAGAGARDRGARAQPARRLQRPDLARARRVLRARRLRSAISIVDLGVPYLLTLPLAGAVCAVAGFLLGLPALRLRGLYLALVTLGLAIATPADHQARRRAHRRHAGPQHRQGHGPRVVGPRRRPVAVLRHARRDRGHVRARRVPRARPGRPRARRDPRQRDRGAHDGRRPRALQDRHVRGQRGVRGRRRGAVHAADRLPRPGVVPAGAVVRVPGGDRRRRAGDDRRRAVRRAVHRVRAGLRRRRRRGAGGRDLRRRADPLHVPAPGRGDGARAQAVERRSGGQRTSSGRS